MGVAQLVRAPGCGPGGRGFETPRSPHFGCRHRVIGAGRAVLFRESHWLSPSVETRNAPLAQLVEQRTLNPQVLGSIPRGRTNLLSCPSCTNFTAAILPAGTTGHYSYGVRTRAQAERVGGNTCRRHLILYFQNAGTMRHSTGNQDHRDETNSNNLWFEILRLRMRNCLHNQCQTGRICSKTFLNLATMLSTTGLRNCTFLREPPLTATPNH